jgi:hypothetical protein
MSKLQSNHHDNVISEAIKKQYSNTLKIASDSDTIDGRWKSAGVDPEWIR